MIAPLKGNGKESPKMRFIMEVEALQQARLNFVTGLDPRAWGARVLLEQEAHEQRAFEPVVPLEAGAQAKVYDSTAQNKNYYYPFGSLTFTPDFKTERFQSPLEHQNTYCDLGLKNLLKTTSVYQILMHHERTTGILDHEQAFHYYKEDVLRQSSDETPRDFPAEALPHVAHPNIGSQCRGVELQRSSGFCVCTCLSAFGKHPGLYGVHDLSLCVHRKGCSGFRTSGEESEASKTFQEEKHHHVSQDVSGKPFCSSKPQHDCQFLPLWFKKEGLHPEVL